MSILSEWRGLKHGTMSQRERRDGREYNLHTHTYTHTQFQNTTLETSLRELGEKTLIIHSFCVCVCVWVAHSVYETLFMCFNKQVQYRNKLPKAEKLKAVMSDYLAHLYKSDLFVFLIQLHRLHTLHCIT